MLHQQKEPVIETVSLKDVDNPNQVSLFIKREDLIHQSISGNKWRKLNYNLKMAQQTGHDCLLTFGGAYSNHVYAVAAAAQETGFKSIGVIRGEEHLPLNSTLRFAEEQRMLLKYVDRQQYKNQAQPEFINQLKDEFGKFYLLPEGGTNGLALIGAAEIVGGIAKDYDIVVLAAGTGGTAAGIIAGMNGLGKVMAISVLKVDFMNNEISKLLNQNGLGNLNNWQVNNDYHFGGYAKFTPELIAFINNFSSTYGIQLDPIYTGKMMYGLLDLIKQGKFEKGAKILVIHTGGLQGIAGFNERFGNLIEV